jgi:hypothetical protein
MEMQKVTCSVVGIAFGFMLAACGGGSGGDSQPPASTQPALYQMRYMHTAGIPFNNGPEQQAQGTTDSSGTFSYESYGSDARCYDSTGKSITCISNNISMSICGTTLPLVSPVTTYPGAFQQSTNGGKVSYQLPPGYSADYGVYTWLPTDTTSTLDWASTVRIASNVTRVSMMVSTTTNLADGLQVSPAVASGTCKPFNYNSTNLEADTASMQAIAPNPLPTVDAGNTYVKELLACRLAGAWTGSDSVAVVEPNSTSTANVTGAASVVFDVAGNMTGYLGFAGNPTAPYAGSLSFGGPLSLDSDDFNYTVPAGSGPLSYTEISISQLLTNQVGFWINLLGPDGSKGGTTRMYRAGMYYFNPIRKYITTIQGGTNQWAFEVDYDANGNVGGYMTDVPYFKTFVAIAGTKQGNSVAFHAFDWNQGRPNCAGTTTTGCLSSGTDTGPSVAPPSVDGSLTLDSTGTTATGTVTMPSDSVNAVFTTAAPLPGCYL